MNTFTVIVLSSLLISLSAVISMLPSNSLRFGLQRIAPIALYDTFKSEALLKRHSGYSGRSLSRISRASSKVLDDVDIDPGKIDGLEIVKYPHPSLRQENELVTEFDPNLKLLCRKMFKLMYASRGVGLAAPQVGINKRLMVFNPEGDATKWLSESILINPEIIDRSTATEVADEGCLSFPGIRGEVERTKWIKVQAFNANGKKFTKKYEGWLARIFQHEYDHLDGIVFIDRLSGEGKKEAAPRLIELIAEFGDGGLL